jgi:hypothetical protein
MIGESRYPVPGTRYPVPPSRAIDSVPISHPPARHGNTIIIKRMLPHVNDRCTKGDGKIHRLVGNARQHRVRREDKRGETKTRTWDKRRDSFVGACQRNSRSFRYTLSHESNISMHEDKETTALISKSLTTQRNDGVRREFVPAACGRLAVLRRPSNNEREMTRSTARRVGDRPYEPSSYTRSDTLKFGRLKMWQNSDCRGTWHRKCTSNFQRFFALPCRVRISEADASRLEYS